MGLMSEKKRILAINKVFEIGLKWDIEFDRLMKNAWRRLHQKVKGGGYSVFILVNKLEWDTNHFSQIAFQQPPSTPNDLSL